MCVCVRAHSQTDNWPATSCARARETSCHIDLSSSSSSLLLRLRSPNCTRTRSQDANRPLGCDMSALCSHNHSRWFSRATSRARSQTHYRAAVCIVGLLNRQTWLAQLWPQLHLTRSLLSAQKRRSRARARVFYEKCRRDVVVSARPSCRCLPLEDYVNAD